MGWVACRKSGQKGKILRVSIFGNRMTILDSGRKKS